MTSKDKLIEFLKSAELPYELIKNDDVYEIELEYTIYIFHLDGSYYYQENY